MLHTAIIGLKGLTLFSVRSSYVRKDDTLTLSNEKPIPPANNNIYLSRHHKVMISMTETLKHVACVEGTNNICSG